MRPAVIALLFSSAALAADGGLPARSSPSDYPVHGQDKGITIAAELMDPQHVDGSFSTDLSRYAVVEVAVYPKPGSPLDLSTIDFALRVDGRMLRPAEARNVARINQKRSVDRSRDIALYPTVGMTTGTWGTGVGVGVGVGVGGNAPGPASSDRDREVMEQELEDKALEDGMITKPVAGYLYFPVGSSKKKADSYELEYKVNGVDVKLTLKK